MEASTKATNIKWHPRKITAEEVETRNGHKGCVVWFTGLSAAGKSTIAVEVEKMLFEMGCHVFLLDGDNVRHGLNKNLGFSPEDREENIRRVAEVSKLFHDTGMVCLSAFISPYRKDRMQARSLLEAGRFLEVFVYASIETCAKRDPKGLYRKAMAGEIKDFTGISAPYEEPDHPELVLDTEKLSIPEAAKIVIEKMKEFELI